MLEILTFTGIDESTNLDEVREISAQYPQVEFGILYGSQSGMDNPIFPSVELVRRFRDLGGIRTAIHLCGQWARVAAGEAPWTPSLRLLCEGFRRTQINLHGDYKNPNTVELHRASIKRFAEQTATDSVILQHRGTFDNVPVQHPRIEYLFDLSEGSGQEGFDQWPEPPAEQRAGYAGGLGSHNIAKAMEFLKQHPTARVWLDMERNIRTDNYLLDLNKVREVCRLALDTK